MKEIICHKDNLDAAAAEFMEAIIGNTIIAFYGHLGAGKTTFIKAICDRLGVEDNVCSPTFTIVNEYEGGRIRMFHFDTYRLADEDDFINAGLDEYFGSGVCVIEWSDVISGVLPGGTVRMRITGSGEERIFEADDEAKAAAEEAGCEIL